MIAEQMEYDSSQNGECTEIDPTMVAPDEQFLAKLKAAQEQDRFLDRR